MKANNNSDKRHHQSYIHPRTSLPVMAAGCFALMIGAANAATVFTGAVDNTWEDVGNWSAGFPDAADDVSFQNTAATLASTATIRRLLLEGAGDVLTIDAGGDLTGSTSVALINTSAQLIVNNGGGYTRAGTLDIRNGGGGITINDGGFFSLGTLRAADGTFAISGSTADVTINNITTVDPATNDGNNSTFTANNANLTVNSATLNVSGLMQWDGASAINVGAGSTLNFAGSGTHVLSDGLVTAAGGVVQSSGAGTQTLGDVISGDGSFVQNGTGTTTLSGANTYTGGTTLSSGTLVLGDAAAAGTGAITLSGGTLEIAADIANDISATGSTTIVNNTGALKLDGGAVTGTGTLAFSVANQTRLFSDLSGFTGTISHDNDAGGQLRLWNQPADLSGTKIVTSGGTGGDGLMFIGTNDNTIGELSGTGGEIAIRGITLTIGQSTDTTYSGLLRDEGSFTGTLVKDGAGSLTLDSANTYTGGTTLNAGTLVLGDAAAAGTGTLTLAGGTLQSSSLTHTNDISVTASTTTNVEVFQSFYDGDFTGSGTINFIGSSAVGSDQSSTRGDWSGFSGTLAHDNTSANRFNIQNVADTSNVKLFTKGDTAAGNTGIRILGDGNGTFAELSGTGGRIILRSKTLTVNQSSDTTYSGTLSDDGSRIGTFVKGGSGALTLDGANTYTGTTTVNAGTLSLASGSSHSGSGSYAVNGGILEIATGVDLSGHDMTISLGGVISPGNSPGTASTGSQTWLDGGSYLWEINNSNGTKGVDEGWDWLDITGTLELGGLSAGGFTIDIDSLSLANSIGDAAGFESWSKGDGIVDYSFIIATTSAGISGFDATDFSFDSSGFSNGPSWDWQIKLSGNDLVLEAYAVPEPSSTALLGLGGLALMLRRKRS